MNAGSEGPDQAPPPLRLIPFDLDDDPVVDAGAARNTVLQLASQIGSAGFTAGLTLYLVRALGPSNYGVYALAVSIGGLVLYPAGLGLPWSIGRFLADHLGNRRQVRAIFDTGMMLQLPAAVIGAIALFVASGALADAYGDPHLGWPLRWAAVSVIGQALFGFLTSVGASIRRVSVSLWMSLVESALEASTSIAFVVAGASAAGAVIGKVVGYTLASVFGLFLTLRLLGRRDRTRAGGERQVSLRAITRYAGAMFIVDVTWSAIAQVDVLLIGAILTSAAVGSFGAIVRLLAVLGYLGIAVSAGVAPRLSLVGGAPDTRAFLQALRYLIIVQGLVIAPMLVWATPIVHLLLGSGYGQADEIMRWLTLYYFVGGPAALITVAVTYLGEARRRVVIMLGTLVLGLVATYVLLRVIGVVGAAIADDLIQIAYVAGHLWICSDLMPLDLPRLTRTFVRTLVAAAAMSVVLFIVGTGRLSVGQWLIGAAGGGVAYLAAIVLTREVSLTEFRSASAKLWAGIRR